MILIGGGERLPGRNRGRSRGKPSRPVLFVIGLPHEDLGSIPHADAGLSEPVSDEQLMTYLCQRLAPHKLPCVIERVTMLLRGEAGKVRRPARASAIEAAPSHQQIGQARLVSKCNEYSD